MEFLFSGLSGYNTGIFVWTIVSLVLAIVGALVGYFLFLKPDKKQDNKFLEWIKDFFNFKKMLIEDLLKILYAFLAIYITLSSFALIGVNFFGFIIMLVVGNLIARVSLEASLILIMIWKNTNEINKKMGSKAKEKESK